jgi:hypothetical protein
MPSKCVRTWAESSESVTVQEHERGRMRLGQNDCLQGEKEIRKEISDSSYLHNIHKVTLFTKYASHLSVGNNIILHYIALFEAYYIGAIQ